MNSRVGFHVSISGGISNSIDNALKIGCNAFQIFSRNPRGWAAKALQDEDAKNFRKKLNESKIERESVFVHMPYLPNLSSSDSKLFKRSVDTLIEELIRCNILGIPYIVLHVGNHGGIGKDNGVNQLVKACNFAVESHHKFLSGAKKQKGKEPITLLLENSAGGKNSIASKFDEMGFILDKIKSSNRGIGVCLDTCHAFAAGYDLRTENNINDTLDQFNSQVGFKNLKVVHLNDSKDSLNSNRDRHEHIGLGNIGKDGFTALLNHKEIRKVPMIMETPVDKKRDDCDNLKVVLEILDK